MYISRIGPCAVAAGDRMEIAMNPPASVDGIPVFTNSCFPNPMDHVHVHKSSEYPEYVGVLHRHEYIEIVYVISGRASHVVNGESIEARRGDLFIVNCGVPHAFCGISDGKEPFCAYDLMFTPEFFAVDVRKRENYFDSLSSSFLFETIFDGAAAMGETLRFSENGRSEFGMLFKKIYDEYYGMKCGYINIIRAYVIELIIQIVRRMKLPISEASSPRRSQMINQTLEYLQENYMRNITLGKLSAMIHVSSGYFSKLFCNETGMSLTAYLKKLRINAICEKLASTDESIGSIARECGIEDMKSLYSAFHSEVGMTPGEYRKRMRNSEKNRK